MDAKRRDARRLLGNIGSLTTGEVLSRALALGAVLVLARRLGPDAYGLFAYATSLAIFLGCGVRSGFASVGAGAIAREDGPVDGLAIGATVGRLVIALALYAALGLWVLLVDRDPVWTRVVLIVGLTLAPAALDTSWVFKGLERNGPVAAAFILRDALLLIWVLLVVDGTGDVVIAALGVVVSQLIAYLALGGPLLARGARRPDAAGGLRLVRAALPFTPAEAAITTMFVVDILVLEWHAPPAAVGIYGAASRLCLALAVVMSAIRAAYRARLGRAIVGDDAGVAAVLVREVRMLAAVLAPLAVGGAVVARPLMVALLGPGFADAAAPLRILLAGTALAAVAHLGIEVLSLSGRARAANGVLAVGTLACVALNLVLVPLAGTRGAALAVALSWLATTGLLLALPWRRGTLATIGAALGPFAAALVMGATILLAGLEESVLAATGVGALVYVGALVALRAVPEELREAAGRGP